MHTSNAPVRDRRVRAASACLVFAAAVAAIAASAPSHAQQASTDVAALEEVTVTARRREESLQDVPIAVSSFSGAMLETVGADDLTYIAQETPNVTLENSRATNPTLTAFIRGIGQQDPVAGFEQATTSSTLS